MTARDAKVPSAIGFLTVCEHGEQGYFGGYLILNATGRPLEFHCTAPVRPSRAQAILYGPTLRGFVCGDQIGPALAARAKVKPQLICVDVPELLDMRATSEQPIVLVLDDEQDESVGREHRSHSATIEPQDATDSLVRFALDDNPTAISGEWIGDRAEIERTWPTFANRIRLTEPFARIREAIDEARKSAA